MIKIIKSIWNSTDGEKTKAIEVGESVLKSLIENDLSGVPIVGVVGGFLNIRRKFIENRFKKNVAAYFEAIKNGDKERLSSCIPFTKEEEFHDIGLSILIDSEQTIKATLFGNLHYALSKSMLSYSEFHTLILILHHNSIPVLESIVKFDIDRWLKTSNEIEIPTLGTENLDISVLAISSGLATKENSQAVLTMNGILMYYFGFRQENPWLYWLGFVPRNPDYVRFGDYRTNKKPMW